MRPTDFPGHHRRVDEKPHRAPLARRAVYRWVATSALLVASLNAHAAVQLSPKVYLHGAGMITGTGFAVPMKTTLRSVTPFPTTDPYGVGITALTSPATTVDWVKVELLSGPSAAACNPVYTTAGFLLSDGKVVAADGTTLSFPTAPAGTYNVRISHRNHATLISTPVVLSSTTAASVDLTSPGNLANPSNTSTRSGYTVAIAGDANGDKVVDIDDQTAIGNGSTVTNTYSNLDITLDGVVRNNGSGVVNDYQFVLQIIGTPTASISIPDTFPTSATCGGGAGIFPPPQSVPTLSKGMLAALSALLACAAGIVGVRRGGPERSRRLTAPRN